MKKPLLILIPLLLCACSGPKESSSPELSTGETTTEVTSEKTSEATFEKTSEEKTTSSTKGDSKSSSEEKTSGSEQTTTEEEQKLDPMDEPYIGKQYYLNHIGDIYSTWNQYRGKGITIAVIDAGFNPYHEDFTFADGTSKVLSTSAYFYTNGSTTSKTVGLEAVVNMGDSHGSFCAGVAAAGLNGKGVIGVAPEASLLLLKTDLKPKSVAAAFRYAADQGAKVVSISIGSYYDYVGDLVNDGSDLSKVFNDPVAYCLNKGTVVISAGGNGGEGGMPTEYTWPGATPGVIGVGGLAANSSGEIWDGSSYNSSREYEFCDVFAPAANMFGCCHYDNKLYDGGPNWKGTSFAAPQVAGMAALYFEKNPSATPAQFQNALFNSCHKITTSAIVSSDNCGYGRVDVGKLLGIAAKGKVTIKVKTSWSSCYAYAWDLDAEKEYVAWPGKAMGNQGGVYTVEIDAGTYPNVLFTKGNSGPQTADLLVSSFLSGKRYEIPSSSGDTPFYVGSYR